MPELLKTMLSSNPDLFSGTASKYINFKLCKVLKKQILLFYEQKPSR